MTGRRRWGPLLAAGLVGAAAVSCADRSADPPPPVPEVPKSSLEKDRIRAGEKVDPYFVGLPPKDLPPADKKVETQFPKGTPRPKVLAELRGCLTRVTYLPTTSGKAKLVEVYDIRGEDCRKRLGRKHYTFVSGLLHEIGEGVPDEPPEQETASALRSRTPK